MHKRIGITALVATLAACTTAPGYEPQNRVMELPADFDFGPAPQDVETTVHAYMQSVLKDPDSVVYALAPPFRAQCFRDGLFDNDPLEWAGWMVRGTLNGRNSYGGYTGQQPYVFAFTDGAVDWYEQSDQIYYIRGLTCEEVEASKSD